MNAENSSSPHWFGEDAGDVALALGHSRNFVTAPGCSASPMAAEHINGLCDMLEKVAADRERLIAALQSIVNVPSVDETGQFCTHHHTADGEYSGTEYHDPMLVFHHMLTTANEALVGAGGHK